MEHEHVRLRLIELALEHRTGPSALEDAEDFAEFVFDREPRRLKPATAFAGTALLSGQPTRKAAKRKR